MWSFRRSGGSGTEQPSSDAMAAWGALQVSHSPLSFLGRLKPFFSFSAPTGPSQALRASSPRGGEPSRCGGEVAFFPAFRYTVPKNVHPPPSGKETLCAEFLHACLCFR